MPIWVRQTWPGPRLAALHMLEPPSTRSTPSVACSFSTLPMPFWNVIAKPSGPSSRLAIAAAWSVLLASTRRDAVRSPGPHAPNFRPAQILMSGEDIAFLDFDGFCRAEPGLDLALFRTTFCDLALRAVEDETQTLDPDVRQRYLADLDGLCESFLSGYREVADIAEPRLALWDALTSAKDILDCWRKVKFEHLDRRIEFLRRRLAAPVDRDRHSDRGHLIASV